MEDQDEGQKAADELHLSLGRMLVQFSAMAPNAEQAAFLQQVNNYKQSLPEQKKKKKLDKIILMF